MKKGLVILAVIIGVFFIIGASLAGMYNSLVTDSENVKSQWSQVENQLQRRADLIPNLVETVKGYAAHEKEVIGNIADARAKLAGARTPAEATAAEAQLGGALSRLLVVVENYPNLKADANFRALMDELTGSENRVAIARKDYNDAVQAYNTKIRTFPKSMIAGMFGFSPQEYFKAEEGAAKAPKVDFGTNKQ